MKKLVGAIIAWRQRAMDWKEHQRICIGSVFTEMSDTGAHRRKCCGGYSNLKCLQGV
jgi:hypothetical protein